MTLLAWQRAGAPSGPAVVLLHAWASDGVRDWETTGWVGQLAGDGFDVLVPDLPGHGSSADVHLPPDEESAAWTANALAEDLAALGVEKAGVAGFAEGCVVAGHLALRAPAVTPAAAPSSGGAQTGSGHRAPALVGALALVGVDDRQAVPHGTEVAGALRDPASRVWQPGAAEAVSNARAGRRNHLPTLAAWAARAAWPAAARLGALHIPVLFGVGADDERRDRAPALARLFHDARIVTVPGRDREALTGPLPASVSAFLRDRAANL